MFKPFIQTKTQFKYIDSFYASNRYIGMYVCMCAAWIKYIVFTLYRFDYYFNTEYDAVRRLNFSEPKKMLTARFPNGK